MHFTGNHCLCVKNRPEKPIIQILFFFILNFHHWCVHMHFAGNHCLCVENRPPLHRRFTATTFMTVLVGLLEVMATCFYAKAKCPLVLAQACLAASIMSSIVLLARCLWPSTFDLVCLGTSLFVWVPLCSSHSPGQVLPCSPA